MMRHSYERTELFPYLSHHVRQRSQLCLHRSELAAHQLGLVGLHRNNVCSLICFCNVDLCILFQL